MNWKPKRKVSVGAITGAVVVIVLWYLRTQHQLEVPAEVASAITMLASFAMSWAIPEHLQEDA